VNETNEIIRSFILAEFLPGESASNLKDDTPLRANGIIDSLGMIKLMSFLEQRFGIEVATRELKGGRFDRIESIAAFVNEKRSTAIDAS
jgi:acyl carrier protein